MVLSYKKYNEKVGLGIFCPITSKAKGYPFEVKITGQKIYGCVLSDQIKNLDWKVRNTEFIEKIQDDVLDEVIEKVKVIIE